MITDYETEYFIQFVTKITKLNENKHKKLYYVINKNTMFHIN